MDFSLYIIIIALTAVQANATARNSPPPTVILPDAADRANQTLQSLFSYFWMVDPLAKNVGFFFSCGQIGGGGSPYVWNKCSCYTRTACVNCYRWWDAIALESTATYGIYTKTKIRSAIPRIFFSHSPYNGNWDATTWCTFIDDFAWYGIAYLRVYDWLEVICTGIFNDVFAKFKGCKGRMHV